jgi:hypothetical protein
MIRPIIEAVIVGIYTTIIYAIIRIFIMDLFGVGVGVGVGVLFLLGFLKHFLGYLLGLHSIYCKYGFACGGNAKRVFDDGTFIIYSIFEGIYFVFLGGILFWWLGSIISPYVIIYLVGFILHILFEIFGMHKKWCSMHCVSR